MATPAISDGLLFVRGMKHLYAIGAPSRPACCGKMSREDNPGGHIVRRRHFLAMTGLGVGGLVDSPRFRSTHCRR